MKLELERVDDKRVILSCNGFELDCSVNEDGIFASLTRGLEVCTELTFDWGEKHINEEQG